MKIIIEIIAFLVLLFGLISIVDLIPFVAKTFPLKNPEAVIYTLSQNVMGAQDFAIDYILTSISSSLKIFLVIIILLVVCIVAIQRMKKNRKKFFFKYFRNALIVLNAVFVSAFIFYVVKDLPIKQYIDLYGQVLKTPEHSELFLKEYVFPDSVSIKFPERKKNLLLIMLESMEAGFQDSLHGGRLGVNLIPEISYYMAESVSFSPGGIQLNGMGWTMGDVVGKTCGIPLFLPPGIDENGYGNRVFLPNAKCLTEILIDQGYNVSFSKGANLKFASMNYFLKSHGNPNAYDLNYYLAGNYIHRDSVLFWGVRDKIHYEFVKEKIDSLDRQKQPWAMWLLSVDTHTPYGYLDESCKDTSNTPEEKQYPLVVRCASKMLNDFLLWAQAQSWYDNTVIAVMGDHYSHASKEAIGYSEQYFERYWLNFFLNVNEKKVKKKREFSSLDMYPTILEAMGVDISGHALGLGRSLFSEEPTLLEKYGKDKLNAMMIRKSIEYDYFLYSK